MRIGIQYNTWFDYSNPGQGKNGEGWIGHHGLRPFKLPKEDVVKSYMANNEPPHTPGRKYDGICYSSMEPDTAYHHAKWLRDLGVDFVIFDCTNLSKSRYPKHENKDKENGIYQASLKALEGFDRYNRENPGNEIKVAYQLSLTCWREQCYKDMPEEVCGKYEMYTWNQYAKAHVEHIHSQYDKFSNLFETIGGDGNKPLLLFYCNQGFNMYDPSAPYAPTPYDPSASKEKSSEPYKYWLENEDLKAHNPDHKDFNYPRWDNFREKISIKNEKKLIRDLFSVRFSLHCPHDFNFSSAPEIWPFVCDTEGSIFNEAGYAALRVDKKKGRDIAAFERLVKKAYANDKKYLILRCFNEFSTTDEEYKDKDNVEQIFTMEVNNRLSTKNNDGIDGHWYYWEKMKGILKKYSNTRIGIQYSTWFDYLEPGAGEDGAGWKHAPHGTPLRPFKFSEKQVVRSHMIDDCSSEGICYSSMDPSTATQHARWLRDLSVNFVIFDCTNLSKFRYPKHENKDKENGIYQASLKALEGFRKYNHNPENKGNEIKVTYQLSLTCWREFYKGPEKIPPGIPGNRELYTWNKYVKKHVEAIYKEYLLRPDLFETVPTDGNKPLLIFYCNQGSNVYNPKSPNQKRWPSNQDLKNKGNYPRWLEFGEKIFEEEKFEKKIRVCNEKTEECKEKIFDEKINVYNKDTGKYEGKLVRDLFSIRFSLYCHKDDGDLDFSPAPEIWPFMCDTEGSIFNEAGYAALRVGEKSRSIDAFDRMVDAAHGKPYLILRCFNEFSTTNEDYREGLVYTMEVNNRVHHHDEQKGNRWFHWDRMREKLASIR